MSHPPPASPSPDEPFEREEIQPTPEDPFRPAAAAEETVAATVAAAANEAVTAAEAPPPTTNDPYAALRIPAYRRYVTGWFLLVFGQQIQSVAVGWEVFQRTRDPLSLGIVGLMQALPLLMFTLPAGAVADKFDRRWIVGVATLVTAAASFALAGFSYAQWPVGWMYAALFVSGTAQSVGWPARAAIMPALVPRPVYANAATWNSSLFQVAAMAGPAAGGFVVAWSTPAAYVIYAVLTLVFTVQIVTLRGDFRPHHTHPSDGRLREFFKGIAFVHRTKLILAAITLDLMAVILGGAAYLLPVFADEVLGTGEKGFGLLRSAEAIGALIMAMIVAHRPPFRRAGLAMLWSVAGFGAAVIVFGFSKSYALSFLMLVLMGAFDNISVIVRHTLVTLLAPDHMRGRVNAVNTIFIGSSNELGGVRAAAMASWFGPEKSVIVGGIGTLMSVGFVAWYWPQLRSLGKLTELRSDQPPSPKPQA